VGGRFEPMSIGSPASGLNGGGASS
jgi:hypothetical protein